MIGSIKNRKKEIDGWLVGWIYKLYEKYDGWLDGYKKIYEKYMDGFHIHNYTYLIIIIYNIPIHHT